jgi:hypothetical protein
MRAMNLTVIVMWILFCPKHSSTLHKWTCLFSHTVILSAVSTFWMCCSCSPWTVISKQAPSSVATTVWQIQYNSTGLIPYVKDILRNSDALETIWVSGLFSKLNIQSMRHWWKLGRIEMSSRRSSLCTISHVIVADVTSSKQVDLRSMH